jgi:hypothetical protein
MQSKTAVRPVYVHAPAHHFRFDLVDFQSRPSGKYKWVFCFIDVFSRYMVAHAQTSQ